MIGFDSLGAAQRAAAITVGRLGAYAALPSRDELVGIENLSTRGSITQRYPGPAASRAGTFRNS